MHVISALLYSFSANLDIFIVGLSYGVKKSHIPFFQNLVISLITFAGTVLSLKLGSQITAFIPPAVAQSFGCILLISLGSYYTVKSVSPQKEGNPGPGEQPLSCTAACSSGNAAHAKAITIISMKEAVFLGFALSINNIGMGIGASITGVEPILTSLITLILSFVFLFTGNHIGKIRMFRVASRYADTAAGLLLIGLGIYQLLA